MTLIMVIVWWFCGTPDMSFTDIDQFGWEAFFMLAIGLDLFTGYDS